jgi:hypothetical protein
MFCSDEIYVFTRDQGHHIFPNNYLTIPQLGDMIESFNHEKFKVIQRTFCRNETIEIEVQKVIETISDNFESPINPSEYDPDFNNISECDDRDDDWFEDPDMGDQ